jgi:hypothetical protein
MPMTSQTPDSRAPSEHPVGVRELEMGQPSCGTHLRSFVAYSDDVLRSASDQRTDDNPDESKDCLSHMEYSAANVSLRAVT